MSSRVRVKICGCTRAEDLRAAADCGADAVGINVAAGPRRVSVERAAELARSAPAFVTTVLLTVDWGLEEILAAVAATRAQAVQLHGDEDPELVAALRRRVCTIKAVRVRSADTLDALAAIPADAYLLDAFVPGQAGGTGAAWDHSLLAGRRFAAPVILAGGLRADNVAAAVAATRPWGVDTSSGVESAPGIKDHAALAAFVAAATQG